MHIGFSGFVLDGGRSGIATYILGLLGGLQQVDPNNQYDLFIPKKDIALLNGDNKNFHIVPSHDYVAQPIVNILWHNLVFPLLAKKNHYDLLHIPTFRRIPYFKGCRTIVTVHDLAPMTVEEKYDPLRTWYHQKVLKQLIHRCDHVITVSHATKADILHQTRYPESKISVIHSGIDSVLFSPSIPLHAKQALEIKYGLSAPFFVYVSRIEHPGKNHLNLIKAFEQFTKREQTPHKLVLAGADWNGAEVVKDYAAQSPVRDRIVFLGFVPKQDLVLLYNACDLMVFPSLYEGFGFPVLEAMACGAPVLCSYIPALEEVAGGHAYMFDPEKPEQICTLMCKALADGKETVRRTKAIEYARTFSWTECAKKVLQVYSQV